MVAAVAEKGYVDVAVADVVSRARVSRATFYEQFRDKADCFVAALQACTDQLTRTLRERAPRSLPPRARLGAFLDSGHSAALWHLRQLVVNRCRAFPCDIIPSSVPPHGTSCDRYDWPGSIATRSHKEEP